MKALETRSCALTQCLCQAKVTKAGHMMPSGPYNTTFIIIKYSVNNQLMVHFIYKTEDILGFRLLNWKTQTGCHLELWGTGMICFFYILHLTL